MLEPRIESVKWDGERCLLLDQTRLPREETYLPYTSYRDVADAITRLVVRGAPAIGVAGAYASVLAVKESARHSPFDWNALEGALSSITSARPTAVNLKWAVDQIRAEIEAFRHLAPAELIRKVEIKACELHKADCEANREMARIGSAFLPAGLAVMTYCNTGDLATGGIGTAFGVLRAGHVMGKVPHVFACETRPVLQGMRLTAWELTKNEIPFTLICDNMAATILAQGKVGSIIVGADRIAANGDVANKVGTYSLAILAKHFGVPFFVAAPCSTFDLSLASGKEIPIEERAPEEIFAALGTNRPTRDFKVANPSFDVTPASLIRAIFCEKGAIEAPSAESVRAVFSSTSPLPRP